MIDASHLRKGFGDRLLIDDLSFSLPPGGIVGVIGPNGAGKTTLIKMLRGEETPDGGELNLGESVKLVSIDQTREGLTDKNSVFEEVRVACRASEVGRTSDEAAHANEAMLAATPAQPRSCSSAAGHVSSPSHRARPSSLCSPHATWRR